MRSFFILILFTVALGIPVLSQDSSYVYNVNLQGVISSANTPFWLHSNTFGNVPEKGSFALGQFSVHKKYKYNNPRFLQWSGGIELITNAGKTNKAFFSDLFLAAKAGPLELSIGQRKDFTGLSDSTLTSGGVAMSSNYRPYPKIQISTPKFFNVIPGSNFLALKFSYSDGILGSANVQYGNVSHVPDVYLHQKSLYARLGGEHGKLSLYAGFNHQAMWGGEDKIFSGGLKRSEAYNYVIFGKPWLFSRVGNHFGTIDVAIEIRNKVGSFLIYRQNIYDDGSLAKFSNIADGLNGIRFKRKKIDPTDKSFKINTALIEVLYTKNQGGSVFDYDAGIFGRDDYFNHYVYNQGWSYRGRSLGTPLAHSQSMIRNNLVRDPSAFTNNNRFISFHTGLDLSWHGYAATFKGTFSKNYGTYNIPFPNGLNQTSLLLHIEKPVSILKRSVVSVSLASDIGQLYPNNTSVSFGWKKSGFIRRR